MTISTGIPVNLFNAITYAVLALILIPLLEWCVSKHRSRGWMRELRAGRHIQLSSSSLRAWMLHAEYNSSLKRARVLNILLGLLFVALSIGMEYGVGATMSYEYSDGTVYKRLGLNTFAVPYVGGLRYDHIEIYLSRFNCKGRGMSLGAERLCEAGDEDRRNQFIPDPSFLTMAWPGTLSIDLEGDLPNGRIDIGQRGTPPFFTRAKNCVCSKFKGTCVCVHGQALHVGIRREQRSENSDTTELSTAKLGSIKSASIEATHDAALQAMVLVHYYFYDLSSDWIKNSSSTWRRVLGSLENAAVQLPLHRALSEDRVMEKVQLQKETSEVATLSIWSIVILCFLAVIALSFFVHSIFQKNYVPVTIESMYRRACLSFHIKDEIETEREIPLTIAPTIGLGRLLVQYTAMEINRPKVCSRY